MNTVQNRFTEFVYLSLGLFLFLLVINVFMDHKAVLMAYAAFAPSCLLLVMGCLLKTNWAEVNECPGYKDFISHIGVTINFALICASLYVALIFVDKHHSLIQLFLLVFSSVNLIHLYAITRINFTETDQTHPAKP